MPGVGTITISGTIAGFPSGSRTISLAIPITSAVDATESVVLQAGFNQIDVPTGARYVLIVPPSSNTTGLTLKGATGDTGNAIHPSTPAWLGLAAGVNSIGVTAAGTLTGPTEFVFF